MGGSRTGYCVLDAGTIPAARCAGYPALHVRLLSPGEVGDAEWRSLAESALEPAPFSEPGVLRPLLAHLGQRGVRLLVVHDGPNLALLWPVRITRNLPPLADTATGFTHDYVSLAPPLVAGDKPQAVIEAALGALSAAGITRLRLRHLPLGGPVAHALFAGLHRTGRPFTVIATHTRALLEWGDGFDAYARRYPRSRRNKHARLKRRMEKGGTVSHHVHRGDDLPAAAQEFLALEAAGWKGRAGTALGARRKDQAFFHAVVDAQAPRNRLEIHSLRVGGEPVAAVVFLKSGSAAFAWKIAYDEAHASVSPGALLLLEATRDLMARGVSRLDSCASDESSVADRFWLERAQLGDVLVSLDGSPSLHRMRVAALRGRLAARAGAKALVTRLRGNGRCSVAGRA